MKNIFILLFILTFSNVKSQTDINNCTKSVYNIIDSIFIEHYGFSEYSSKRDQISFWLVFHMDSISNVDSVQLKKSQGIDSIAICYLKNGLKGMNISCLHLFYVDIVPNLEYSVKFPFNPKKYEIEDH